MEKALRFIGYTFLSMAEAIHEAKNAVDSFLFDFLFDDDHLMK
jgi:hypothetical protein